MIMLLAILVSILKLKGLAMSNYVDDIECGPVEFIVKDVTSLARFFDKEIGVDYEITKDDNGKSGSFVVFDLLLSEYEMAKNFITENNLWEG